jgi:hypothetical protein
LRRVPRHCLATVLDVSDQADPGIARSLDEAFDIRVAGGIVDDDRLPSIDRLTEDAVDALLKKIAPAVHNRGSRSRTGAAPSARANQSQWGRPMGTG